MTRRLWPYAVAVGGAVAITVAIGLVTAVARVAGLSALYLLLVLWLGARWGRGPAVAGSIAAFLLYDFFFVPPVGTFSVRGPAELLELIVLVAVALVTSQLAASQRRAQAAAEAVAKDSRALYELATAMLRTQEVGSALTLVGERARTLAGVDRFAVVGESGRLAGSDLSADEVKQARWSHDNGKAIGIAIKDGVVVPMKMHGGGASTSYLPLSGGVVVLNLDPHRSDAGDLRMLAALIGLADLLLDRRRAALEAERARGFEASDRLKAAILSSLSHELKSPLASLRAGLTALTAPQAGLQADQRMLVTDMDRQANRLDRMVGDLLALSRLEAGMEMDREPHGLADVVGGSLHQMKAQLRGHEVTVRIPDDLPPVDVDEMQVGRVVTNLIENAIEWAPSEGAIEIGALVVGDHVEVWVENEGPPIAPADLDHVFDTFWTRRTSGTGLGLAISKRVVEAHGGTIGAENRRRGPRFTFTLPVAHVAIHT
jgi:two-component system, OmpR family, sensor histidine kinase KdpD